MSSPKNISKAVRGSTRSQQPLVEATRSFIQNSIRKYTLCCLALFHFPSFHFQSKFFYSSLCKTQFSIGASVGEERCVQNKSNVLRTRRGKIVEHKSCAD